MLHEMHRRTLGDRLVWANRMVPVLTNSSVATFAVCASGVSSTIASLAKSLGVLRWV